MNDNEQCDELARDIFLADNSSIPEETLLMDWADAPDRHRPYAQNIAAGLIAKGYSKSATIRASDDGLRTRLVDLLLAYKGTPRHKLFEYPHRDDDSRAMIGQAEAVALGIIHTLNATEATP